MHRFVDLAEQAMWGKTAFGYDNPTENDKGDKSAARGGLYSSFFLFSLSTAR